MSRSAGSGEAGGGDAVGVAGRPLDQLDPVTVWIGDPAGLRSVRAAGTPWWLGRGPFGGKVGESRVQRLNLDDEVIDAAPGPAVPFVGSQTGSMVTKWPPGSWSMVRLPDAVSSTVPATV